MKKKLINPLVIGLISAGMVVGCTPSTPAKKAKVTGIEVAEKPTKTEYYVNETISLDGLVVNAKFDNGKTEVISDYTTNVESIDMSTAGSKPVTITYQEKFSTTFSIRVSELPREDWTDDEKAIMQEHLYGEILPVVIYQAAEVSYDEESEAVVVEGGTVYRGELESYAAKFTAEAGWEGGDVSAEQGLSAGSLYQFEKAVTVEEQTRYVVVLFGAMSSSGAPAQTGTFHLEANDPYEYEFPSSLIGTYLSYILSITTTVSVPDFGAPRYLINLDTQSYLFAIFGLDATEAMLTAFVAALQEAHWISGGLDKYGYVIAVSPDEKFQISFFFDAEEELFSLYVEECSLWPSNTIAALLAAKNLPNETVPALTGEGYIFALDDSGKYGDIEVGVYSENSTPDEIVTAYQALLTAAEYTPANTTDDYPAYLSKSGNVEVTPYVYTYQSGNQGVFITINAYGIYPVVAWPSEAIAAILTAKTVATDVVPAFNNAANVTVPEVSETATSFTLTVDVASGSAEDAVATYIDSLEEAGYAVAYKDSYGDSYFVSENKELTISPYVTATQSFKISVRFGDSTPKNLGWPDASLQAAFLTYTDVTITDTVPADGLSLYAHNISDDQAGTILVYAAVGVDDLIAELSAYAKTLTDAGYTLKTGTQNTYVSPNAQLEVTVGFQQSLYGYYFVVQIDIQGLPPQVWPADKIAAILGEEITDPVPSIDGAKKYAFDGSGYYALIEIAVTPAGSTTPEQLLSEYVAALTEAKYTFYEEGYWGDTYVSENHQLLVTPYVLGSVLYIDIDLAPVPPVTYEEFPADIVTEFFAEYEVEPAIIPYSIAAEDGYYTTEEDKFMGYDALYVYCYGSLADDLSGYHALLTAEESGWTLVQDYSGDILYTDGNGTYVYVENDHDYGQDYDLLIFYYVPATTTYDAETVAGLFNAELAKIEGPEVAFDTNEGCYQFLYDDVFGALIFAQLSDEQAADAATVTSAVTSAANTLKGMFGDYIQFEEGIYDTEGSYFPDVETDSYYIIEGVTEDGAHVMIAACLVCYGDDYNFVMANVYIADL